MIHTTWHRAKHKHWLKLNVSSWKKSSSDDGAVRGTTVCSNTQLMRVTADTSHATMMGRVSTVSNRCFCGIMGYTEIELE